jgi:hypothetical protein
MLRREFEQIRNWSSSWCTSEQQPFSRNADCVLTWIEGNRIQAHFVDTNGDRYIGMGRDSKLIDLSELNGMYHSYRL